MPEWVENHDIWIKAKDAFKQSYGKEPESAKDFSIVTTIYKNMNGKIKREAYEFVEKIIFINNKKY